MSDPTRSKIPSAGPDPQRVRQVEILISALLRAGVITSLTVIVLGTVLSFVHHPDYVSSKSELSRLTKPGAAFPHTIPQVIDGVRRLQGRAVVMAGLLLLIGTPVLRVAVSIVAFIYERDRVFTVITSIVLALLLLSFVLGKAGG